MCRLLVPAVLAFLTGCSNAPIAGFLDAVAPARGGGSSGGGNDPAPVLPDMRTPAPKPATNDEIPPPGDFAPPVGPPGSGR